MTDLGLALGAAVHWSRPLWNAFKWGKMESAIAETLKDAASSIVSFKLALWRRITTARYVDLCPVVRMEPLPRPGNQAAIHPYSASCRTHGRTSGLYN
jgi:hypothetical protein